MEGKASDQEIYDFLYEFTKEFEILIVSNGSSVNSISKIDKLLKNYNNTNPFFVYHNDRKVLYFASDRKGGYGEKVLNSKHCPPPKHCFDNLLEASNFIIK